MERGVLYVPSDGAWIANSYLLYADGEAALADPTAPLERVEEILASRGLRLRYLLLTHAHYDHVIGLYDRDYFPGVPLCVHAADAPALADAGALVANLFGIREVPPKRELTLLAEGDTLPLGQTAITVCHTPGHTPGSVCYRLGTETVTGDTLFAESIGATRFPGGDPETLAASVRRIVRDAPERIYPGHGADAAMEDVLAYNPYVKLILKS